MINDATNSIARMYQNTVSDFFKQAMIDYVLGVNLNSFVEFSDRVASSDPGEILRLALIRSLAIETTSEQVLADGERKLNGWTLLSPTQPNRIQSTLYEEKVLILTDLAIYCCSYEYHLQKVNDYLM